MEDKLLEERRKFIESELLIAQHTIKDRGRLLSSIEVLEVLLPSEERVGKAQISEEEAKEIFKMLHEDLVNIYELKCEHCGKTIYACFDKNVHTWPYFGNQAKRTNCYKYSSIVSLFRRYGKIDLLLNSYTKVHCKPSTFDPNVKREDLIMNLCNDCFSKTYNRILLQGEDSTGYARFFSISIVEEWGDKIEDIAKKAGVKNYQILGKGAIKEY